MQAASAYVPSDTYFSAIDKLEHIVRSFDRAAPDMVRTDLIQVVGEDLGLWPMCVLETRNEEPALVAA